MIGELQFCLSIGAASRLVAEAMDRIAGDHGLLVGPASVLVAVAANPGKTQVSYSSALVINDATLTRYIDRLEAADLLERRRGREDRRVVLLHLTEVGATKAAALSRGFAKLEKGFRDSLGSTGFEHLEAELHQLALSLAKRGTDA